MLFIDLEKSIYNSWVYLLEWMPSTQQRYFSQLSPPPPLPPRDPPSLPPREFHQFQEPPSVEPLKTLPKDRRCFIPVSNRSEQPFTIDLSPFKELANKQNLDDRAKYFLEILYSDPTYKKYIKKKRGAKAKNWKFDGDEKKDFIYPILHEANNIYNAFHKKSSLKNKNRKEIL